MVSNRARRDEEIEISVTVVVLRPGDADFAGVHMGSATMQLRSTLNVLNGNDYGRGLNALVHKAIRDAREGLAAWEAGEGDE